MRLRNCPHQGQLNLCQGIIYLGGGKTHLQAEKLPRQLKGRVDNVQDESQGDTDEGLPQHHGGVEYPRVRKGILQLADPGKQGGGGEEGEAHFGHGGDGTAGKQGGDENQPRGPGQNEEKNL